jgi:predicted amidohydrolase YtcJ
VLDDAGVTDATPDPKGGAFIRDERGRPTGLCLDAACGLVEPVAVDIGSHGPNFHTEATLDELVAAVGRAGRAYVAAGLTTVCDAQVTRRELAGYREARRRGEWWVRVACMPLSHQLDQYGSIGLAGPFGDDLLWLGPMKLYMDGSLIGGTAVFEEPYGKHGEFPGLFYWEPAEMRAMIAEAHRQGWQVGVHTQGDRAIGAVLDAIEAAMEAHPRPDPRHRIEHCGFPRPDQIERMARLGVIAVCQPNYLHDQGDEFLVRLGERAHRLIPMREELDAGVAVALSSDADVTSFNPLETIGNAVARTTMGGRPIGADQALSVEEAIRAHTIGAAFALFADDRIGSIEPGKYADLTVIDGDPFAVDPREIRSLPIWMTVIGGDVVHGAGA